MWVKLVDVSQVKHLSVVEEKTFPQDSRIDGVDSGDYHVYKHNTQDVGENGQGNIGCPVAVHIREVDSSKYRLPKRVAAGDEAIASFILLQQEVEVVGHDENEEIGPDRPDENAHEAESEEPDEGTEDAGHFEGEEETQDRESEDQAEEVGLARRESGVEAQELLSTSRRSLELLLML